MPAPEWQGPPEAHPLDSARGKLVRAKQHAHHLCDHCAKYGESEPVHLVPHRDGDAHLVFVEGTWPPLYLGLILGEVIHDLRSALDHVAWQLAVSHAGRETVSHPKVAPLITFPITSTRPKFDGHKARPYFSAEATEILERLQPYHNDPEVLNPLALVQRLSNIDKHQVLTPFMGQLRLEEVTIRFRDERSLEPWVPVSGQVQVAHTAPDSTLVNDEIPILRVRVPHHVAIWLDPPPVHVCFLTDVTGEDTVFLAETIPDLCLHVAEATEPFAALFPSLGWRARTASWTTPGLDV
jgi:hypothetical protein